MAKQSDIAPLAQNPDGTNAQGFALAEMPKLPADVKDRFPSLAKWESDMLEWHKTFVFKIRQALGN